MLYIGITSGYELSDAFIEVNFCQFGPKGDFSNLAVLFTLIHVCIYLLRI